MNAKELKLRLDLHAVANRLGIPEWPNRTGSFCSPLRPDRSQSFSIFEREGELFWKDHATSEGGDSISLIQTVKQCDPKSAIEWLATECGVQPEPKFAKKTGKSSWDTMELQCTYDYRNAAGEIVHQTLRFRDTETGKKTFRQRRRAAEGERFGKYEAKLDRRGGGWWIWNLGGIEPLLYRLPEILAAPDRPVWIFEGEKDADNAAKIGLLSTTSPMGAGKWRASFTEVLKTREIVVCPDRDDPGTAHAALIAKSLEESGGRVSIIDWNLLAPGRQGKLDFSDWGEEFLKSGS